MINFKHNITFILFPLLLSSCASGHSEFYRSLNNPNAVSPSAHYLNKGEQPKVYTTTPERLKSDVHELESQGYEPLGYSSFNGEIESEREVIAQAKKVGATVVISTAKFVNSQTNVMPLALPDTRTTYTNVNMYGSNGYATGSGVSTSYGTQYVPIQVNQDRYDQEAIYLILIDRKYRLGVKYGEIDADLRRELQRNTGALVRVVMKGSVAFRANIIPGDVIIKFNEEEIIDPVDFSKKLDNTPVNSKAILTILRRGDLIQMDVTL